MTSLKIIFMGTPEFSVPALKALHGAGYDIVAVYSQPPRPVGRGYKITPSPVHDYAASLGIPVFTPKSLRSPEALEQFRNHGADLAVVVAYGLILPSQILDAPKYGCLNIHASLLPRWRGAAPIQRSILAGDTQTGITIMKMDEGLDTGPMLAKAEVSIGATTTASLLHDQLSALGAELIVQTIPGYVSGQIKPEIQPVEGVTYASKLSKEESRIDWSKSAEEIDCQVRAFSPWPGTYFVYADELYKVAEVAVVELADEASQPGLVLDEHLTVVCGQGAIQIKKIQKPGGKWMGAEEFLRGHSLPKGITLPCPAIN